MGSPCNIINELTLLHAKFQTFIISSSEKEKIQVCIVIKVTKGFQMVFPHILATLSLFFPLFSHTTCTLPSSSRASPYPACSRQKVTKEEARGRGKVCSTVEECRSECKEEECSTKYEYSCTEYKRKECEDRWQNLCTGRRRSGRARVVYDTASPLPASDLPLHSPSQGQTYLLARTPDSRRCWRQVRQCRWQKYKTVCGSYPIRTCQPVCQQVCEDVYYCSTCPEPVGPPAIPPPGSFIIRPPAPPPRPQAVQILDVRRKTKQREKIVP